jgi:predicted ATP-dependent endonuclease of OLD family
MKIEFVHIQNFRKLKDCRIDFSEKETVFVGANNSGKTTAMDALILFFKAKNNFTPRDFTLFNWKGINSIAEEWVKESDPGKLNLTVEEWENFLPSLDVWLNVNENEIHYVTNLIPTLDWNGGLLGVRLRFEPNNVEDLYKEYHNSFSNSKQLLDGAGQKFDNFKLWPKSMWAFLERRLNTHFKVRAYLLDPSLNDTPQKLSPENIAIENNAFEGLIKVDIINAQRGFSDINTDEKEAGGNIKNLSSQLRSYYDKHLNPSENPTVNDLTALKAIQDAKDIFDTNLKASFESSIAELEDLNYPGFGNPKISLSSKFNTVDSLNHESSVLYNLSDNDGELSLPEKYNGLGYQNLVSMIFKLIRFRDEWMQVGKRFNAQSLNQKEFEPLHLVLIEEPEAHLHAQVQQVFIKEAYRVLRNNSHLGVKTEFTTQLVVSTHSNHIAHEMKFICLRYFKRADSVDPNIKTTTVVNLSKTFGTDDETTRFAIRYLKTTHCDLFFADAVIMVEGPAERMLVPYFIKNHTNLTTSYISVIEIGGSHAHTLRPLIENLGIITLIITDLDSVNPAANNSKVQPENSKEYNSGNDTLKSWLPQKEVLQELLLLGKDAKIDNSFPVRVAYQIPLRVAEGSGIVEVYPYTFEDSLVMENRDKLKELKDEKGLMGEMVAACNRANVKDCATAMYDAITKKGAKKAEFALNLLFLKEPSQLKVPEYISEGLEWLGDKLDLNKEAKGKIQSKAENEGGNNG